MKYQRYSSSFSRLIYLVPCIIVDVVVAVFVFVFVVVVVVVVVVVKERR